MASLPLSQIAVLCQTLMARLEDMTTATRTGHERAQPVAVTKLTLDVPTFSDHDAGKSVNDFLDELALYRTVSGASELGLLERVLPVALRGTAAQWLRLQPPFLSWDQFVAAFRAEFLLVDYDYRIRRELDARTLHRDEGLRAHVRAMQGLYRRAYRSVAEFSKVSHALRRCHPRFRPYLFGRSFSKLAGFAQQITETLFWEQQYAPPPPINVALESACAWRETNTGTVPTYCPQPLTSVAGLDRELGSLGLSSGNAVVAGALYDQGCPR